jgi:murein DD-endopeptidase MepM/ murein hydrolase activator NlpD
MPSDVFSLAVETTLFSLMLAASFDGWPPASRMSEAGALPEQAGAISTGFIDVDGDGAPDFANPTMGPMRGVDAFGSGEFHAERDGGKRIHEGADYIAEPNTPIYAPITGVVTKIGYAYAKQTALTFVELTNEASNLVSRVLYVDPSVAVGDTVNAGAPIGVAENLQKRYRGITNHVHVQIAANHMYLDPANILPDAPTQFASTLPAHFPNGENAQVIQTKF